MAIRRGGVAGKQFVAGQLFLHEAIVRLVGVERRNHVIAIAPGLGPIIVDAVAVAVGVTHQIEPVPRPAFAVVRDCPAGDRPGVRRRPATYRRQTLRPPRAMGGKPTDRNSTDGGYAAASRGFRRNGREPGRARAFRR